MKMFISANHISSIAEKLRTFLGPVVTETDAKLGAVGFGWAHVVHLSRCMYVCANHMCKDQVS